MSKSKLCFHQSQSSVLCSSRFNSRFEPFIECLSFLCRFVRLCNWWGSWSAILNVLKLSSLRLSSRSAADQSIPSILLGREAEIEPSGHSSSTAKRSLCRSFFSFSRRLIFASIVLIVASALDLASGLLTHALLFVEISFLFIHSLLSIYAGMNCEGFTV